MIHLGRFQQQGELTELKSIYELDESMCLKSEDFLLRPPELEMPEQKLHDIISPASNLILSQIHINALLTTFNYNFKNSIANHPNRREVILELDELSRPVAAFLTIFIASTHYFKKIHFLYSETKYEIDGMDLKNMLNRNAFWHEVYNFPSKLITAPQLPGRFDASKPKSIFINGGLDFGRVLHLAEQWEPQEIQLTCPEKSISHKDPALISAFENLISKRHKIGRLNMSELIDHLNEWYNDTENRSVQPMLICGGWKLQTVVTSLWAFENSRVPVFICAPDFISKNVEKVMGPTWKLSLNDPTIIA